MRAQHSFKNNIKQIRPVRDVLNSRIKVSPRGMVSSFTGEWLVMLFVPLNIYVMSVNVHTQ